MQHEVSICRRIQPFLIRPTSVLSVASVESVPMEVTEATKGAADDTAAPGDAASVSDTGDSMLESVSESGRVEHANSEVSDASVTVLVKPLLKLGQWCFLTSLFRFF